MKKFILTFTALLLVAMLAVSAYASTNALKVSNSGGQLGHTVFLTVTLTESIAGDTLGITYDYDDKVLEALPESCKWEKTGILQDFSQTSAAGVWATDTRKDMSGVVCTLAFKIRTDAKIGDTKVQCTLIVKNGSDTVATYNATGVITVSCDHEYSAWISNGSLVHKHTCSLCGNTQSQSHNWDNGVTTENKDANTIIYTYTCTTCGATKQTEVEGATETTTDHDHGQGSNPTTRPTDPIPTTTRPTDPVPTATRPTDPIPTSTRPTNPMPTTRPTNPTSSTKPGNSGTGTNDSSYPQQSTNNQNGNAGTEHDHDHVAAVVPGGGTIVATAPGITQNAADHDHGAVTTQDPHAGHDHSSETTTPSANQQERLVAAIGIFAVLGLFLIVSILLVKKKHR